MKNIFFTIITIMAFQIDAISQINLTPPSNLQAIPNGNDIQLTWSPPDTSNSLFLSWDQGNSGNAIGLSGPGSFLVAARWDSALLEDYVGYSISKIAFFIPGQNTTYTSYIWQGPNADSVAFNQSIDENLTDDWTFIYPNNPISINILQDLWVGYELDQSDTDYGAGTDFGPAISGYGDMIFYDGTWASMSQLFGLDFNFNIRFSLGTRWKNSCTK
ncbi:MAG: hypothetical protein R2764_01110 [Bacteroidales bacterium]